MAQAFVQPNLDTPALRKRFAEPDSWQKPSVEVERLVVDFGKTAGARAMAEHLRWSEHNRSTSFKAFTAGVRRLALDMGWSNMA